MKTIKYSFCMVCLCLGAWVGSALSQDVAIAAPAPTVSAGAITTAQVPRLVRFSGTLLDENGKPRTGVAGITFLFYKDEAGGAPLWLETQNVKLDANGRYTALLGFSKPDGLPTELFAAGEARWLAVQPENEAEHARVLLLSVPYALKAMDAETLGGRPVSDFVLSSSPAGNAGVAVTSTPQAGTGSSNTVSQTTGLPSIIGSGTKNFIPIWTSSSALGNSTMFESGGKVGVGTTSPVDTFQVTAPNQLGLLVQGPETGVGAGIDLQTTGTGGKGWELLATGRSSAQGPSKLNIRDLSTAADVFTIAPGGLVGINNTTPRTVLQVTDNNVVCCSIGTVLAADAFKVGTAIFGDATGTSGLAEAVFGQIFSPVTGSAAVIGEANGSSGQTSGVSGFNVSSGKFAAGIVAAEEASSGATIGVSSVSDSPNGTGVLGLGQGMSNTANSLFGCCAVGVWGDTRSNVFGDAGLIGTADDARAIYLQNNSPSGVPTAFMFQGAANQLALQAGGSGGFCTIDSNGHENCPNGFSETAAVASGSRRVALYAMESPQQWFEDFGAGRLENGAAAVALDPTFAETVNGALDYHVFLTPEGDCRGLYVSRKTASGFEVRELGGGQSTVAFDYRIVALRRGSENVRLEDVTERWNKVSTPLPAPVLGPRFTPPSPPPAPRLAESNISAETRLNAQK